MVPLQGPELFADFLLLQRIAVSEMAEVWIAVRLGDRSGRTFVIKRPLLGERPSGRAAQAIAREGEVLSAVCGGGFVALEAAGDIAGLPYIAIEHVRGAALDAILDAGGALSEGAARAVARDLAAALADLHAAGWVHGDVAPSNILVDDSGELRLIDFGLATKAGARHIEIAGKPGYIAPEAVRPVEAAAAEDIYGWGVVVAECALGRRLFKEESLAEAGARGEAPVEASDLDAIIPGLAAALKRDPSARPTAASIIERLKPLDADRTALAELVGRSLTALTPTAPMAIEIKPRAPSKPPASDATSALAPRPSAHASPPNRWKTIAISLLILIGLVAAAIGGRLSARRRDGAVSVGGPLPRRAQIELDGRSAPQLADGPAPVEPGRHSVIVTLPKGDRREYAFNVRPGEHVILMAIGKGDARAADSDDRSP